MTSKKVDIGIYHMALHVFTGSLKAFNNWLKKNFPKGYAPFMMDDIKGISAVTSRHGPDVFIYAPKEMDNATLVHELAHAAFLVLDYVEIPLSQNREEYAYLLEYLYHHLTNVS